MWSKRELESQNKRVQKMRTGEGPTGLLGRFKVLLPRLRYWSKSKGYHAPNTTPEEMLAMWNEQKEICVACGGKLELRGRNGSCFDHDHVTGQPRGFIHDRCNKVEGMMSKMTLDERTEFLDWLQKILAREVATATQTCVESASHAG